MSVSSLSWVATIDILSLLFIYLRISADDEILSIGFVPLNISSIGQNTGNSKSNAFIILSNASASAI